MSEKPKFVLIDWSFFDTRGDVFKTQRMRSAGWLVERTSERISFVATIAPQPDGTFVGTGPGELMMEAVERIHELELPEWQEG